MDVGLNLRLIRKMYTAGIDNDLLPEGAHILKNCKGIKCCHINIRSLIKKFDELSLLVRSIDIDILCVTETWLTESISDHEISLANYVLYRKDWPHNRGRGICCYVKSSYNAILKQLPSFDKHECLWLEIFPPHMSPVLMCTFYRHPCEKVDYMESFIENLDRLFNGKNNVIILGDFNLNLMSSDKSKLNIIETMCNLYGLKQYIQEYTRVTDSSSTLIDHIYSNMSTVHESGVVKTTISDHYMIYFSINGKKTKSRGKTVNYRSYKHFKPYSFLYDVRMGTVDLNLHEETDPEKAWKAWKELFISLADKHAPYKARRVRSFRPPWLTADLLKVIRQRDNFHKVSCRNPGFKPHYQAARNMVNFSIKKAKKNYTLNAIHMAKNNPKKVWDVIKTLTNNKEPASHSSSKLTADMIN